MTVEAMYAILTEQQKKTYTSLKGLAKPVGCFEVEGVLFRGNGFTAKVEFAYNNPEGGDFYVWCQKHYKMYQVVE